MVRHHSGVSCLQTRCTAGAIIFLVIPTIVCGAQPQSYDQLCDAIIANGQAAARSHNAGQDDQVLRYSALALEAYKQAAAQQPAEPQAHANMAVFMLNSQRYVADTSAPAGSTQHSAGYWQAQASP